MATEAGHQKLKAQIAPGFYYTDISNSQFHNQMQSFGPNSELFHLQMQSDRISGMQYWRDFPDRGSTSSRPIAQATSDYCNSELQKASFSSEFIAPASSWQENRMLTDDSSLRCVLPNEGKDRPSQVLSLSLFPSNGLQSFELMDSVPTQIPSSYRDGFVEKASGFHSHQAYLQDDRPLVSAASPYEQLKRSKYLLPTQGLLNEFCSLGSIQNEETAGGLRKKSYKSNQWEEGISSRNQSLSSLDFHELRKRKTHLVSMLEELDRRYRRYYEQMRAVVTSFEAVAGPGSATVYCREASKATSRRFRCLRDAIVGQIRVTKKAMEEKDPVALGTTKGDTPRLKLLDQAFRQQKSFQHLGMDSNHPWRPQRGLPERSVSFLRAWLFEHFLHPYPSDVDKHILARQTGLTRSQVSNWFINARVRLWKPMVEEMYMEEAKEQDSKAGDGVSAGTHDSAGQLGSSENGNTSLDSKQFLDEQKPMPDQLVLHDSESLSSVINNSDKRNPVGRKEQQQDQVTRLDSFGLADMDFSSHGHHSFVGGPNEVSLKLGLQQHAGSGDGLSFSPAGDEQSLYFSRPHMEDCQPVQYSMMDGESHNLPYLNLMGSQLLHDLAG